MLVGDESDITTVMRAGLEKEGFTVDAFNDPHVALSQFKPNYYNAIVLDVRMPGMSGFDLAKQIWIREPSAKVCFLSAFEIYSNETKKVFTNFKAHSFIKKPIRPTNLAKHIEAHFWPADQLDTRSV